MRSTQVTIYREDFGDSPPCEIPEWASVWERQELDRHWRKALRASADLAGTLAAVNSDLATVGPLTFMAEHTSGHFRALSDYEVAVVAFHRVWDGMMHRGYMQGLVEEE